MQPRCHSLNHSSGSCIETERASTVYCMKKTCMLFRKDCIYAGWSVGLLDNLLDCPCQPCIINLPSLLLAVI